MNPVAVAKFFQIICDAIFMSLFGAGQIAGGLFGPISNYFATVETNSHWMLHLHYLVWLRSVLHLATLRSQIQSNAEFRQRLLSFLKHIIKCSASENPHTKSLDQVGPDANDLMTMPQFADLLRSDNEAVAPKVQMYLPFYNPIYYKYNTRNSRVCRFDFPRPTMAESEIDLNGTIRLKRDNV